MKNQEIQELAEKVSRAARACSDSLGCDLDCPYGDDKHCYKHFCLDVVKVAKRLQELFKPS